MTLDDGYVPLELFGEDHWSTLAYAETVMVECAGFQVGYDPRMRQGRRNYRVMTEQCPRPVRPGSRAMGVVMDNKYSTRLNDGSTVERHDDWHCVQDMVAAGLMGVIDVAQRDGRFERRTDAIDADPELVEPKAVLGLTPLGMKIADQLREHKRQGGRWRDFSPKIEEAA